MKTKFALVLLVVLALGVAGCGSGPKNLIVGQWEAGESGMTMKAEFDKDGTVKITMLGQTVQGTYKVTGDDLEWTMNGNTAKSKIKVTANELEMTMSGQTIKYKRA